MGTDGRGEDAVVLHNDEQDVLYGGSSLGMDGGGEVVHLPSSNAGDEIDGGTSWAMDNGHEDVVARLSEVQDDVDGGATRAMDREGEGVVERSSQATSQVNPEHAVGWDKVRRRIQRLYAKAGWTAPRFMLTDHTSLEPAERLRTLWLQLREERNEPKCHFCVPRNGEDWVEEGACGWAYLQCCECRSAYCADFFTRW